MAIWPTQEKIVGNLVRGIDEKIYLTMQIAYYLPPPVFLLP
jgi:hypothetical protein